VWPGIGLRFCLVCAVLAPNEVSADLKEFPGLNQRFFSGYPNTMPSALPYAAEAPTREAMDAMPGATLLEFGTDWCGYCRAAESVVSAALAGHPRVRHLKVEDGSGRPLGRSYRVKLWPTLIFLDHGKEVARLVRPTDVTTVEQALTQIDLLSGGQ
jgi:thioredoxin 1